MAHGAKELAALVASLGETARFCVSGVLEAVLPGLAVKGVGPISLPILPSVARRIVGVAERAPYGRGAETLVDTDVRRVWQVDPANVSVTNPAWQKLVDGAVETVKQGLGIRASVRAELYKLLIYEKGSFFTPHRDSEQADGMFATLVATPPEPPVDWRLDPQLRCRCRDCPSVNTFLQDPALQILRLPLSKERCKHLHRALDATRLPVTHTTDRRTSPNTLVLTKTRLAYQRRLREHAHESALLDQLKLNKPAPHPRAKRRA